MALWEIEEWVQTQANLSVFLRRFRTIPVTQLTLGTYLASPRPFAADAELSSQRHRGLPGRLGPAPQHLTPGGCSALSDATSCCRAGGTGVGIVGTKSKNGCK